MFKYGNVLKDHEFLKKVLFVAIPMMIQQLITNSVNLLDNLMVGRLGDYAISGVALSNKYFMLITFSVMGVAAAATIFMAQYYGAQDYKKMQQGFHFSLISTMSLSLPLILIALLFPRQIVGFFTNDAKLIDTALLYIPIAAFTFIPQAISITITSAMRSMGETKNPLVASIISMVCNAFFNYCLIFGHFGFPKLGVSGAALGTLMARFIELGYLSFVYNFGDWPFKSHLSNLFKIPKDMVVKITSKAIPLTLNEIAWSSGMILLFKFYSTRGAGAIAGMTIASTTSDLFFILFSGMAVATNVLVAHPLGSKQLDVAKRNAFQLRQFSVYIAVGFGILLFIASFITPHFYNVSHEVFTIATNIIRIQAAFFCIYVYNTEIFFIIRAGGDTKSTLIMDAGYMWSVNLVVVGLCAYLTDINIFYLYMAGQCTDILKLVVTTVYFNKGRWLNSLS